MKSFTVVKDTVSNVLTQILHCENCNSELVAKPLLEMRSQINKSLYRQDKSVSVFIEDEAFLNKLVERSLNDDIIEEIARLTFDEAGTN